MKIKSNKVPWAESISDHMYRMSIMAMIIDDKSLDMMK